MEAITKIMLFPVPKETIYSFEKGDNGWGVWALQKALQSLGKTITVDGYFGDRTDLTVRNYQKSKDLYVDGVAGAKTQYAILSGIVRRIDPDNIANGLVDGILQAESGRMICAVNSKVDGGVDLGYTQRRVYEPYTDEALMDAFNSYKQVARLVSELRSRYETFYARSAVASRPDRWEYAWRLAALAHNWPYGADRLSKGYALSNTTATWVPAGTKFPSGEYVNTFAEWAKYYAMGSHQHNWPGLVTKIAFGVPTTGLTEDTKLFKKSELES